MSFLFCQTNIFSQTSAPSTNESLIPMRIHTSNEHAHRSSSSSVGRPKGFRSMESFEKEQDIHSGPLSLDEASSDSWWWPGAEKKQFALRPCSRGFRSVLFTDSQGQSFDQEHVKLPGFLIHAYSGCDLMKVSKYLLYTIL